MVKTIAIILLIYGVAGIVGTFVVYGALKKPLQRLRELLQLLAKKLDQSGDHTKTAGDWINKVSPILQKVADLLAKIVAVIREVAQRFGEAAGLLKSIEAALDAVKVPALAFQTKTLNLSFGAAVLTSVSLEKYNLDITPGIPGGNFTLYGPPITLGTTTVGLNLGQVPVVTGISVTNIYPLQPVGDVFHAVGDKVEAAQEKIDGAGDRVDNVKDRALEAKENVEKTSERLRDFAQKLEEASQDVKEMSENKLLALIPALALGYFGLIHLAFALTGLALFFV